MSVVGALAAFETLSVSPPTSVITACTQGHRELAAVSTLRLIPLVFHLHRGLAPISDSWEKPSTDQSIYACEDKLDFEVLQFVEIDAHPHRVRFFFAQADG